MTADPILAATVLALTAERLVCFARWLAGWRKRQESRRRGEAALKRAEARAEMRAAVRRRYYEIDRDSVHAEPLPYPPCEDFKPSSFLPRKPGFHHEH